jgi:hypothetical protein
MRAAASSAAGHPGPLQGRQRCAIAPPDPLQAATCAAREEGCDGLYDRIPCPSSRAVTRGIPSGPGLHSRLLEGLQAPALTQLCPADVACCSRQRGLDTPSAASYAATALQGLAPWIAPPSTLGRHLATSPCLWQLPGEFITRGQALPPGGSDTPVHGKTGQRLTTDQADYGPRRLHDEGD